MEQEGNSSLIHFEEHEQLGCLSREEMVQVWKNECIQYKLEIPLDPEVFDHIEWKHVSKYDNSDLEPNFKLKTSEELRQIKRRHHRFPYCHPGPIWDDETNTGGWYFADSITQHVKLLYDPTKYYVVRWVGYPDE